MEKAVGGGRTPGCGFGSCERQGLTFAKGQAVWSLLRTGAKSLPQEATKPRSGSRQRCGVARKGGRFIRRAGRRWNRRRARAIRRADQPRAAKLRIDCCRITERLFIAPFSDLKSLRAQPLKVAGFQVASGGRFWVALDSPS